MKLSIITATFNAEKYLPELIESLKAQTDKDFEWVIADGLSRDRTVEVIESTEGINITIISQADFGVYDALNQAIKVSKGEYYLVVGADDKLYPNAVRDYKKALVEDVDIVTGSTIANNKVVSLRKRPPWLVGQFYYVNGHAVGSVFKKNLHNDLGFYSNKYPIAADQDFILSAVEAGSRIKVIDSIVGEFSLVGMSSRDLLGSLSESMRVNIDHGFNKYLQIFVFLIKIIKNLNKI